MKLYSPSEINEIRTIFGFRNSKSLGQNFLTDKNIIDRIIEGSEIGPEDLVIEIGPGIGVITREAAAAAKKVVAVEIDEDLLPVLQYTLGDLNNVEVVNQDILKTDLKALIKAQDFIGKVRVIGNLPYYITTPIIMKLLEEDIDCETITVMMQKEVADRLKAAPGKKECGAISLRVQYFADVKEIAKVPRTVFIPQPKVDSTVLRLDVRKEKPVAVEDEEYFFKVIKAGFAQRRKTVANSLSVLGDVTRAEILEALEKAGIEPVRRGETLSLEEYAKLTEALMHKG
ncbi:MAG: 16S rRNA (adenine(1518)-N(6)/adenine(1519)-N(6))-dimethyltransferase RsmA [Firmicutes bacterium]|nr:16S rRNA (adenine(1518)-N(6)/adenine(1519)-N(6))-dimethyltransferase RsmA [Bacillota bacterium]